MKGFDIMLVPHLYPGGKCEKAIELYTKVLGAEVTVLIYHDENEPQRGILHAELNIQGQRVMLNDVSPDRQEKERGPLELIMVFDSLEELKTAYEAMKEGSRMMSPLQATDYSPGVVEFRDRYGIPWGFMVVKPDTEKE